MRTWEVVESTKVKGKHAPAGAHVELTDDEAEPLHKAGLIAPATAAEKAQEPAKAKEPAKASTGKK